jgi:multidrug efflux pump subunit AcrB
MIASTGANLISVLPFLLVGGFFSLLFSELILTICFAVAASLLVALTVTPVLMSRLLAISWSSRISDFWLLKQFNARFEDAKRAYAGALSWALRYRLLVIAIAFLVLGGGSLQLAGQIPQEILPRINTGQAKVVAQFPPERLWKPTAKLWALSMKFSASSQKRTMFSRLQAGFYLAAAPLLIPCELLAPLP